MVKKSMKKLFVGLAVFSYAATMSASASALSTSKNFFQPRAFSANLAREMLLEGSKHRDSEGWYGEFSADAAYQRSWSQGNENGSSVESVNGLGTFPFWSGTNVMTLGTNGTNGVSNGNLDVYQFGLGAPTFVSGGTIALNPVVYQAGADFMFVVGSSANEPCFFAKIKAPVGVYNINPNLTEDAVMTPAVYSAGQIGANGAGAAQTGDVASSMAQAFTGNLPGGQSPLGNFIPMQYGLIDGDQSTGAKFGDIEMTAGYRFISNEDNSFSVAVRAAAPTGGQATAQYMMEPIFGRGGNWALGGYLDGHVRLWEGNNENSMALKFMANAQHLFSTDTMRSYDLTANGQGSKYLLVGSFSSGTNASYQGIVQNLINVGTLNSQSSFGVEGDVVVSFSYIARGWSWDLGYEFWGRSAETLVINDDFAQNTYAVLGRQAVGASTSPYGQMLNCQPLAQISLSAASSPNPNTSQNTATAQDSIVNATVAGNQISIINFNIPAAQQDTSLTSKVFTKVTYEWVDSNYRPHLGVMGEFEISTSNNNALPQWAIALMGGVSF